MEFLVRPPQEILRTVDERTGLLARIETSANMKGDGFRNYCKPLLLALANYVQNCPLEESCYAEPGGALRYGLTAAFFALEVSGTMVFTTAQGSEKRRTLDPQYRFGVFAASLAAVPALLHARVIVKAKNGDSLWSPYHAHPRIGDWVPQQGSGDAFEVEWRRERLSVTQANAVAYAADLFGVGLWQNFDENVVHQVFDAILPPEGKGADPRIVQCVRKGDRCARDLEQSAKTEPYVPVPLPPGVTPEAIAARAPQGPSPAQTPPATEPETTSQANGGVDEYQAVTEDVTNDAAEPEVDPWAHLPAHVIEMFTAIRAYPDYPKMKAAISESEQGIEVPITAFGALGRSPSQIARELKALNVISGATAKSLIFVPAARPLLLGEA